MENNMEHQVLIFWSLPGTEENRLSESIQDFPSDFDFKDINQWKRIIVDPIIISKNGRVKMVQIWHQEETKLGSAAYLVAERSNSNFRVDVVGKLEGFPTGLVGIHEALGMLGNV